MNRIMIRNLDNFKISDIDSDSFILFMYDSFGSITNIHNSLNELEKKIKDTISTFKFKTLQKRNYLPLGHSIYLNYDNYN